MSDVRAGLKYHEAHDWLSIDGETATTGVTDYAQGELGDIVFLELPSVGDLVTKDEPYGTIEAVKTVADQIAPVSGEVVEVNATLEEDASLVNGDPYGEGWTIKVRLSDPSEADGLMDEDAYRELIES